MQVISAPMLDISLFGSFRLHHSIHGGIKENRRKVQALLIWLLLEDNQAHSREQLIAILWPEMNRENGLRNLRVALSRVKKHLADGEALEAKRSEVTLHQSPYHKIDVRQFEELTEQIDQHQHEDLAVCHACLDKLRQVAQLYRGRFLDGFSLDGSEAFEEWLFVWRERYHVMGLTQLGRLAEAEFALNRLAEAEALAQRQIKLDPLQESAHRMLMRISAERGSRTQALRQYQSCTEMLMAELGVPPDEETQQLKQQIESGDYKPSPKTTPSQPKAETSRPTAAGQLPEIITPFIGREEELTLLAERLTSREYRLISLVGPGGIGKTRLAIQAAKMAQGDFADGVFFVPLVGLSHHRDIPATVAEAAGFSLRSDGIEPADQIANLLANREMLLVIDNLEHIIEGADLLLDWLTKASRLTLLVTTRQRINAQVEDLFRLRGLPWPKDTQDPDAVSYEAVRLFGDRAHRLNKQFWLNEDTLPSVIKICQQVEGLPLALELAATSIRDFDVAEIASELIQEPELLSSNLRDLPERHRQFESVFDYSWNLLSESEKQIVSRLAMFPGGFTKSSARQIAGASAIHITRLQYKSLIRSAGNGRYDMHELIRQVASRKSPDKKTTYQKPFLNFFFDFLKTRQPGLRTYEAPQISQEITLELDNIRQAWRWAISLEQFELLKETVPALTEYFIHTGSFYEGKALIEQAVQILSLIRKHDLPHYLIEIAKILSALYQGNFEELKQIIEYIFTITDGKAAYKEIEARAWYYLSKGVFVNSTDSELSRTYAQRAMMLANELDAPLLIGDAFVQLGALYYRFEDTQSAISNIRKGIKIFESFGDIKRLSEGTNVLALTYSESGNIVKTFEMENKLLAMYQQLGYEPKVADQYLNLAMSYGELGAYEKSLPLITKAMTMFERFNDRAAIQNCYISLGYDYLDLGNYDESYNYFKKGIELQDELNMESRLCDDLTGFSLPLRHLGKLDEAEAVLKRAIEVSIAPRYKTQAEAHLSRILLLKGEKEVALEMGQRLWGEIKLDQGASLPALLRTLTNLFVVFLHNGQETQQEEILDLAQAEIDHVASKLTDLELRNSFLTKQPSVLFFKQHLEVSA